MFLPTCITGSTRSYIYFNALKTYFTTNVHPVEYIFLVKGRGIMQKLWIDDVIEYCNVKVKIDQSSVKVSSGLNESGKNGLLTNVSTLCTTNFVSIL